MPTGGELAVGADRPVSTMKVVSLGRTVDAARPWVRRLLHLAGLDAMVCPRQQLPDGTWLCEVIAHRPRTNGVQVPQEYVCAHADEIAAGYDTVVVDPHADTDGYTMVWQAMVWHGRSELACGVARVLAHDIRRPGTIVVDLDHHTHVQLMMITGLRTAALLRLLDRFVGVGLLTPTGVAAGNGDGLFTLTIPTNMSELDALDWPL